MPQIPTSPNLPAAPRDSKQIVAWADPLTRAVDVAYRTFAERLEAVILEGTFAQRPAANGTRRFYYATDTLALYYDDGAWRTISGPTGTDGHTIKEDGVVLTQRAGLNFIGAAITATDDAGGNETDLTLSQSPASPSVVGTGRLVSTTAPLSGGGDLSADRTLALTTSPAGQTPVGVTRVLTAGNGLTGGGDLSADRAFDVGVTAPITVAANAVGISITTTDDGGAVVKQGATPGVAQLTGGGGPAHLNLSGTVKAETVDAGTSVLNAGFEEFTEMVEPAAPAANKARLYSKDVAGKTALFVRFPTGASIQLAIEP
jgi:hypothetical protein